MDGEGDKEGVQGKGTGKGDRQGVQGRGTRTGGRKGGQGKWTGKVDREGGQGTRTGNEDREKDREKGQVIFKGDMKYTKYFYGSNHIFMIYVYISNDLKFGVEKENMERKNHST